MSAIHTYFGRIDTDKSTSCYECRVCKCKMKTQASGTTSHLWTHLSRKHPELHAEAEQAKQKEDSRKRRNESPSTSADAKSKQPKRQTSVMQYTRRQIRPDLKIKYDLAVLKFVVVDGRPFEAVAGPGLQSLCSVLSQGDYVPPHPTTLSRKLGDLRESLEAGMCDRLKNESGTSRISITFDHWKADNQSNYLVLTVHFIDINWNIIARCLSVNNLENIDADHTADTTKKIVQEQLQKYGINMKRVFFASTDTTNTMPRTAKLLQIKWHGCAAHKLQLCINAGLDAQQTIKNLIGCVHKIAGFFNSSTVGLHALHKYQKSTIDPRYPSKFLPESDPPLDVISRFNSTYDLLLWTEVNKVPISLALVECAARKNTARSPPAVLTEAMIDVRSVVLPLLKPTAEATTISADSTVSISMVVPCITTLQNELKATNAQGVKTFRDTMLAQLKQRFNLSEPYLLAASFLDARLKTKIVGDGNDGRTVIDFIDSTLSYHRTAPSPVDVTEHSHEENVSQDTENRNDAVESSVIETPTNVSSEPSLSDKMFSSAAAQSVTMQQSQSMTNYDRIRDEMSRYSSLPLVGRSETPLNFWKDREGEFPLLAEAARDILSIQATNCSSERVNSVGGNIVTDQRHSLSNHNIETLIWARKNSDIMFL